MFGTICVVEECLSGITRYYAEAVNQKSPRVTARTPTRPPNRPVRVTIFFSKFFIIKLDNASAMTHNLRIALSQFVIRSLATTQGLNHQVRGFVVPKIGDIFT